MTLKNTDGVRQEIDIPFPAISHRIKSVLALDKKKKYGLNLNTMNCMNDCVYE